MIVKFSVRNFGSIKDKQTLSFEADKSSHLEDHYVIHTKNNHRLLKLGLIYGANASGKTSVLKSIEFLRDLVLNPEEKKNTALRYSPFLFDETTSKLSSELSIEFIQNDIKYLYEVEFNQKAIIKEELYNFNSTKANIYKRTTNIENQFSEIKFGSKFSVDKSFKKTLESNTLWNNTVLGGYLKTNIELKELKEVINWFGDYLAPMVLSDTQLEGYVTSKIDSSNLKKENIVKILSKADFNISNINIDEEKKDIDSKTLKIFEALDLPNEKIEEIKKSPLVRLEFEHTIGESKFSLPFEKESQGTQRYYGFAGLLAMLIKGSMAIPIDELESSLHPDLFTHFLLSFLINSKSSQIIASTHNREVLNNRDIFRDDVIWFTDKNEYCATELYSLADFDTSVIRDTSNVFNAYKIGKLGGVPNLNDYYIELNDEE